MRTAEEMYRYCEENGYLTRPVKRSGTNSFRIIEENLAPNEKVYMAFMGIKDYISMTENKDIYAYAITNERIMFAQKKFLGEEFKSILLDRFNDITLSKGMMFGIITFDTIGEYFNAAINKKAAGNISAEANRIIFDLIRNNKMGANNAGSNEADVTEDLRKFKALLDDGIITEAEFNTKKTKLLGL